MLTWNVLAPWLHEHGLSNLKCSVQRKFAKRLIRLSDLSYGQRLARTQTRKFGNWVMLICLNIIYDCRNIEKSQFNVAFSALILLAVRQEEHVACKNWVIICLEQGANGCTVYGPAPIISCFFKIQNGLTFLVLAYPGYPGKEADKWVSVSSLFLQLPGSK